MENWVENIVQGPFMSPCTCRWVTRNRATARVLASVFRLYRAVVVIEECEAWWRQMLEVGPCIRALGDAAGSAVPVLHIIGYTGGACHGAPVLLKPALLERLSRPTVYVHRPDALIRWHALHARCARRRSPQARHAPER